MTWDADAKLVGNISAGDIAGAIGEVMRGLDSNDILSAYHARYLTGDDRPSTTQPAAETANENNESPRP